MQFNVANAQNADWEIEHATYPGIRMFSVKRTSAESPQEDCEGTWEAASPETVGDFSAVGYFFARNLHETLHVPIGMVHSSWGGTPAESWTSAPTLAKTKDGAHMVARHETEVIAYRDKMTEYRKALRAWKADPNSGDEPKEPKRSIWANDSWRPSGLYNAMIAPLIPYTIRGAIWYQGESNAGRAYQYRELFSSMIQDWRQQWGLRAFPFYFVQLANFNAGKAPTWPELREAQNMALRLPHTGTAITIDIGNRDDIHPKNKQEVGRRLALVAMTDAYGKRVYHSGPMYRDAADEGDSIRVRFYHTWKGLTVHGDDGLAGFEVAGEDHEYHPASARIDGDTVLVQSDEVPHPVAVRYAWENDPPATLYNGVGLPASPFRSDDWPGITVDAK
jgi:sialate O-acetylesterase